jgi:Protein of unknown function (DUF3038)
MSRDFHSETLPERQALFLFCRFSGREGTANEMMPAPNANGDELVLTANLDSSQLHKIRMDLDLVTIAIAALTQLDRLEIAQIAQDLQLSIDSDWLDRWTLGGVLVPNQLDVEQLRSIVSIVTHLAQAHQQPIRQNIHYWHQTLAADQLPLESPSLADYISRFVSMYQHRFDQAPQQSVEMLAQAALNLLVELLFYSSHHGRQRLWGMLLERSESRILTYPSPSLSQQRELEQS